MRSCMYLPIPTISLYKAQNMTKVVNETTMPKPRALARSSSSSDAASVGRPDQKATMDIAPPIIIAISRRALVALYFTMFV